VGSFKNIFIFLLVNLFFVFEQGLSSTLFDDLEKVKEIDEEINDDLPFYYNASMLGGYFNMPSARMPPTGMAGFGGAGVPPYNIYGLSFQPFSRIELSANYRTFNGMLDQNMGKQGFGNEAERIGNLKIAIIAPEDGLPHSPILTFGWDDFIGTSRFNSQYGVLTKEWKRYNFEASLGWGKGRIKGFFGGVAWSPLRKTDVWLLKDISLVAEWDAINYKKHPHEHPWGRKVKSRVNGGLIFVGWDMLQVSLNSVRGEKLGGSASMRYPLGSTEGIFPKVKDPQNYTSPVDLEPLGVVRPDKRFAEELSFAFSDQGLDLYHACLYKTEEGKALWIKLVNNRYREERVVRERTQDLLAALTPPDIKTVTVVVEADAFPCHEFHFRNVDLQNLRLGLVGEQELSVLAPRKEAKKIPYHCPTIFQRHKKIWSFTARPQFLSFFGSARGKFKYNIGFLAMLDGYLFDQYYYRIQPAYLIHSNAWSLRDIDKINPSQLINVRTDTIKYYQNNSVALEKGYLQKSLNLGKGWFYRAAAGYFERAYGGLATEFLYYPVKGNWAVGFEGAGLLKRDYRGLGFTTKIRKLNGTHPSFFHFLGYQYFLDIYYFFKPLDLDFKVKAGGFLARDKGARFEVARTFKSGFRLSLWYTWTNGHDKVNGRTYFDKGFALWFPLDFFLPQSSRNYFTYAMSAWLRDVGAVSETGKELFWTLREERE
jgi:hypothetical protein